MIIRLRVSPRLWKTHKDNDEQNMRRDDKILLMVVVSDLRSISIITIVVLTMINFIPEDGR